MAQEAVKHHGLEYSFVTRWEENFNVQDAIDLTQRNWHVPIIFGIGLYLPILYFGQKIMANREPMKLRGILFIWNLGLTIFSILGFSRMLPEMLYVLNNFGFQHSICNNSYKDSKPAAFWMYLFILSKFPELIDTIFLVCKKQQLIFLHVYHHASVVMFAWNTWSSDVAAARWYTTMNYGVHSIMYLYYALRAAPIVIRIPKWVSMLITTLQTLQMVMGSYVVWTSLYTHLIGQECATSTPIALFGLFIYVTYLILFSHFFYKAYISPVAKDKRTTNKKMA